MRLFTFVEFVVGFVLLMKSFLNLIIISMNKRKEAKNGAYINPLMYPR